MFKKVSGYLRDILRAVRLSPPTLAEKCRILFGAAILLVLTLALLIPYFWMDKLTQKTALDSGRVLSETVYQRHFNLTDKGKDTLAPLGPSGNAMKEVSRLVNWVRIPAEASSDLSGLSDQQGKALKELMKDDSETESAWLEYHEGTWYNNYVKLVRAEDNCIKCHNSEGSGTVYNKNQLLGAIAVQAEAVGLSRTRMINTVALIMAGLMSATGAVIAFYLITQRVILRPIRQLRSMVNNVSEGNLDVRSAIKSGDEFERLSDAFNHMLDGLQAWQEKLRQANVQLDGKIAQLSDRNIELYKANKLKSEFLANMSHEFRTPLNSILGFAQLLREKPADDPDKSRRYAENIIASGRALLNMINDLLDLAKAEAGKMELRIEKISIEDLCQGIIAFFSPMTEHKRVRVRLDISDGIPVLQTDVGKVQQILYNLLSNAIKFTPEDGKIAITAQMLDERILRMSVSDTGPGIESENLEHIFEKFRQIDGSITRKEEGTGLGLAISKELSLFLAGDISAESTVGAGSVFYLDIPVHLKSGSDQQAADET